MHFTRSFIFLVQYFSATPDIFADLCPFPSLHLNMFPLVYSVMYILCNEEPLWMSLCLNNLNLQLEYKGSWKKTALHQYALGSLLSYKFTLSSGVLEIKFLIFNFHFIFYALYHPQFSFSYLQIASTQ